MSANNRKTGNLLALGSAAVVAVYGAGFMRTAAAAERFAQQSSEHVLSPAEAEVIAALANESANGPVVPVGAASAKAPSSAPNDSATPLTSRNKVDATTAKSTASRAVVESSAAAQSAVRAATATGSTNAPDTRTTADAKQTSAANAPATGAAQNSATVTTGVSPTVAAPPVVQTATPPATVASSAATSAPVAAPPAPPVNTPAPAAAPVAAAPAKSEEAAPSALKWKDGNYTGYGTSRHGDIEVYLETDGGKISFIKISACLTQYSCSWISELPGQVIARQSPKVDAPSGATQSANAFYYAVVQALSKAK